MCFGDQSGYVHHGEERLVRGGQLALVLRTIGHYSVDRTADFRVTKLCAGTEVFAMCGGELAGRRLQTFLFSNPLQVVQLLLGHLRLSAGLGESNFRTVKIASRKRALLKQFLAAVVDLRLGIERRLGRSCIEFGLLYLLWNTGAGSGCVTSLSLLQFSSTLLRCSR